MLSHLKVTSEFGKYAAFSSNKKSGMRCGQGAARGYFLEQKEIVEIEVVVELENFEVNSKFSNSRSMSNSGLWH